MSYADRLEGIATNDAQVLREKDKEYGGSWLKRGGVGAFMMLCRKWDRLETQVSKHIPDTDDGDDMDRIHFPGVDRFDIIGHALKDRREEGILDDIGDLRRYLLLVEAEVREQMERGKLDS